MGRDVECAALLVVVATALSLSLASASPAPRVAVMPPHGPSAATSAQAAIRRALAGNDKVTVVGAEALARLLASAADSGITCDASLPECATRICAFGGLDFVVVTELAAQSAAPGSTGGGARATLALHDCVDGREVRSASALLGEGARDAGLAALARAALGEGDARGQLVVEAPAGVVTVDGVERGPAPLTLTLGAGVHEVAWRPSAASSGADASRSVEVPAAATVTTTFGTSPPARADDPPASPATRASASVVSSELALGAVAFGALVGVAGAGGAWLVAPADRARYTAREYNDAVGLGRALLVVGAAGALVAAAGGGAFLLALDDADGAAP